MLSSISPEAACTSARPPNCMRLTPLVGPWKQARASGPGPAAWWTPSSGWIL